MDSTLLDIGLRNRHIPSVHSFFKIQTETLRLTLANKKVTDNQAIREYSEWKQALTKLTNVVSANCNDAPELAVSLARIGFQSCNQLILILKKSDFESTKTRALFDSLVIDSIKGLRLAVRIAKCEPKPCEEVTHCESFGWNANTSEAQVVSDSVRSSALVLGQCWLKKYKNCDKNWKQFVKNIITFAVNSLADNNFEQFIRILCQSGLPSEQLIQDIYELTTDDRLRELLSMRFSDDLFQSSKVVDAINRLRNETNIALTLQWVSRMDEEAIQRSFFLSSVQSLEENHKNLSQNIVWNYLIDKNDFERLELWVQKAFRSDSSAKEFPFDWTITPSMVESVGDNAMITTREIILNRLSVRGLFRREELNDFQLVLRRLGRSDCNVVNDSTNGFFKESELIDSPSFKLKTFLKKLFDYCIEHKLNDFLYIYHKNFKQIPILSDNCLTNLLKSSIRCEDNPNDHNILDNLLLTAQYVYSVPEEVTIRSLFDISDNPFLGLIAITYSSVNFQEVVTKFIKEGNPDKVEAFRSQYPIVYSSAVTKPLTRSDGPTVYSLLTESIPFDVTKMFCWQSMNAMHNQKANQPMTRSSVFSDLPHFSNPELAKMYGLRAHLTFTYYLAQGRAIEAYKRFTSNRKDLIKKNLELAARRAALVAYNDTSNLQVAVAAVVFQHLLGEDSNQTLLHLSVANIIMSYASDFLSLNAKQQQTELSRLLKKCHYFSDKRSASKLLQLVVTAITRKYKNYMNIQIQECFDWSLAVRFARFHSLELPLDLLNKCAASDNWLVFTICCQLHEYPKESVLNSLKFFNNECISDHLTKAFQSSHKILADSERDTNNTKILNRNATPSRPISTSRNALYAKIGVRGTPTQSPDTNGRTPVPRISGIRMSTSFQMDNDDQSIASETDYNGIETISVVSSSNASDPEDITKIDPENCPNDLLQVILHFQTDSSCDPRKALMYSSVWLSNPILCLIACSVDYSAQNSQNNASINVFAAFSCWLLASVDFTIRKQFCDSVQGFDALNWTLESSYHVMDLITADANNYLILLRGLKIFSLNIPPLLNLVKFFNMFLCEKNYYHVENLKAFQDSLWKYQEPADCANVLLSKQWIQKVCVIVLTNALKSAKNHELAILLRHYEFARIQDSFTPEIKVHDFRKLYRLSQCLNDTDVVLPVADLLVNTDDATTGLKAANSHFSTVINALILNLQQKGYYSEARGLANSAELESNEYLINEWTLRAEQNLDSIEFWDKCWHSLLSMDSSMRSALSLFHKFLSRIPSLIVKCFLIFKCLIASKQSDNHQESETLESMLWDCVISIESAGKDSTVWSEIWSDIMVYFKSNKESTNRLPTKLNSNLSTNSDQMSKTIDKVIEKLLNNRCIEKAQDVSRLFQYNHQDLDIILTCDNLAKGLIKDLSEAPLTVQLKTEMISKSKATEFSSQFSAQQKERIGFMASVASLSTIGHKACQRILLYYKISCLLNLTYNEIESSEATDLELLRSLISMFSTATDGLALAKELIALNDISDQTVAAIICDQTLSTLKTCADDSETFRENSFSNLVELSATFLSRVRLLNDTTILGSKLLTVSDKLLKESNDANNSEILVKLYIKAHECFSLACDVKGIALVLRKARLFITQHLLQLRDFKSILRLMTGIGRYSEMTYCFDLLRDNNQFELILSKHIDKAPQLRIALMDYLKGDKEVLPLVALRFCQYREIAEMHETSAKRQLIELRHTLSAGNQPLNTSVKQKIENIMDEFIDAHESYSKAGCHSLADSCAKWARIVALQISYFEKTPVVQVLNLNNSQIAQFIESSDNFYEALIVADAYQYTTSWVTAVFNHFVVNNDLNYWSDYTNRRDISSSFVEQLANKYVQYVSAQTVSAVKTSQMKKSMERLLQYVDDFELRFRLASKLNLSQMSRQMLAEESGSYLLDLRRNGLL